MNNQCSAHPYQQQQTHAGLLCIALPADTYHPIKTCSHMHLNSLELTPMCPSSAVSVDLRSEAAQSKTCETIPTAYRNILNTDSLNISAANSAIMVKGLRVLPASLRRPHIAPCWHPPGGIQVLHVETLAAASRFASYSQPSPNAETNDKSPTGSAPSHLCAPASACCDYAVACAPRLSVMRTQKAEDQALVCCRTSGTACMPNPCYNHKGHA